MRSTEHASRDPCRVLKRRHGFAEIVERGGWVLAERPRVIPPHMRLADFVLEGPAAIGLKRTDPEGVPQRQYTSDADYDSASGAEEHEEAADAAASTHST